MGTVVGIIIGGIAGLLIAIVLNRRQAGKPPAPSSGPQPVAPPAAQTSTPEPATLTARLHRLEGTFAAYSANYAHPRELEDQAGFQEAATLLADPAVSLEVVSQYALGSNWALSCAALAALGQRADGAELAQAISADFDKLHLWAMFFALKYLCGLERRPPVGEPLAAAKEWWAENVLILSFFRDYLSQRAAKNDSATFGASLARTPSASTGAIRGFLERVNHPMAMALIGQLDSLQRSNVDRGFLGSFGRFWSETKDDELLIDLDEWGEALDAAQAGAQLTPVRSLVVSGEPRVGKTSFLQLLARRLARARLDDFRGRGRRSDGGPTVVRPARGPHSAHASKKRP